MNNYYYLISSLPSIEYDHKLSLWDCRKVVNFIYENLSERDLALFKYLQYPTDIKLISNYLSTKAGLANPYPYYHDDHSFFPIDVNELMKGPLPKNYLFKPFIEECDMDENDAPPIEHEQKLWRIFYSSIDDTKDTVLKEWFRFDQTLRNTTLISIQRKFNFQSVGINDEKKVSATDFDGFNMPEDRELIHRGNTPKEVETALDKIRWNFIDHLSSFSFFTVHSVFAWFLKYQLLNRWSGHFSEQQMENAINAMVGSSGKDNKFEFSETDTP